MAVSFDLFGTLIEVARPEDPAAAVAAELDARGVRVPDDWAALYGRRHVDAPQGAEVPLPAHVGAVLSAADVDAPPKAVRRAVVSAFDPVVRTRPNATEAVDAARERGPVGVLSNCSVPELVSRSLVRSELDRGGFDAIVSSAACGWRKPHPGAFEAVARKLDCPVGDLVHVGDSAADRGIEDCGGTAIPIDETPLVELPGRLEEE